MINNSLITYDNEFLDKDKDNKQVLINQIKLIFLGDICLNNKFNNYINMFGSNYPFAKIKYLLKDRDLIIGNLEGVFKSTGNGSFSRKVSLLMDPKLINVLRDNGIHIVCLANNHIFDFKEEGLFETINLLSNEGIKFFGAGRDITEARKPLIYSKNDINLGFLGYCSVETKAPIFAGINKPGVSPAKREYCAEDIRKLRDTVDYIIISIHWGMEYCHYPSPVQRNFANFLLDNGADLVIGHHPHVVQGYEVYNQKPIFYSLGNSLFSDIEWKIRIDNRSILEKIKWSDQSKKSIALDMSFSKTEMAWKCFGLFFENNHTLTDEYSDIIIKELKKYSIFFYKKKYAYFFKFQQIKIKALNIFNYYRKNFVKRLMKIRPKQVKKIFYDIKYIFINSHDQKGTL